MSEPAPDQPPKPAPAENEVRMWNMLCHLSALAGVTSIPVANIGEQYKYPFSFTFIK